ncbi:uncharacterized protein LOC114515619 [Dendronephthya gigantea]|uniref:uncharacterized protein LOC114515619 n=1 Tax=Dendronephthya gigantea TaxID=151771 RepID=UPI001068D678|nr:uncharacterized protein LOC114515619 [Dendronephthya gigantea]
MYGDCQEPEPMSQWQKRTKSSDANWENWRDNLFSSLLNSCVIPEDEFICMACGNETAVVKCSECISQYMCPTCDDTVHSDKPLHDRQEWLNGFYHYLKPTESVSREGIIMVKERYCPLICDTQCRSCGEGQLRKCVAKDKIILVTMKGRYDLHWFSLVCEACNVVQPLSLTSIINNGYWPGSPCQVNYLFDQEVFRVWETFKMRMPGSSESAFIKALEDISAVKGRTGIINASTFRKAAAEWRYCQYEVDKLQGITYIDCPPCSMSQHSAHVDGNQKLYRFKSVPRGSRTSYYGDLFIKNNTDVDIQIAEVYSTGKKEVLCIN